MSPWADFCLLYKQDYVFPNGFIARMKRFGYIRCAIKVSDLIRLLFSASYVYLNIICSLHFGNTIRDWVTSGAFQ